MKLRYMGVWLGVAVSLAIGSALAAAPVSSAGTITYWPSTVLSQYVGIKGGQILEVTGENFPPNFRVTLYQCNEGSLGSPDGTINSHTCDMKNTFTGVTNKLGIIHEKIKVDPDGTVATSSPLSIYINHGRQSASRPAVPGDNCGCWGWGIGRRTNTATLIAGPNETWLSPQTVAVTGYYIPPVPAKGPNKDYIVECNPNVLTGDVIACDAAKASTISVKANGDATGHISVVTGAVGDGTCGSGTGDFEVCYLVVGNASGIVTTTPIDFYK